MQPTTFADLGLSAKVQSAIDAAGYTEPTPIQAAAIPIALTGQDVLGIAQTGTGKTASFTLPMITRLETGRARARMPRSLILAPTRELAAQVAQNFEKYGTNHKLNLALLIGGVAMDEQTRKLDRGVDVLIATPGRLIDHFQRGRVMLMGVEILVIDEADRMLDMGFIPDIEKICKLLPPRRQTLFFSATMPPEITRLVDQFMHQPERVEVARPATTANTISQKFSFCSDGEDWAKRERLRDLIRSADVKNAIIFCNRKRDVAILQKSLTKHGFNAGALHGDMDQRSRMQTLDQFRNGEVTLLAASDVAARGLDIPDVSHVFNFDLPWQSDDYVHRIGRTGRAGKEGAAFSLVTVEDLKLLDAIAKITGDDITWIGDPPNDAEAEEGRSRKRRGRGGRGRSSNERGASGRNGSSNPRSRSRRGADNGTGDDQRRSTSSGSSAAAPDEATSDQSSDQARSSMSADEAQMSDSSDHAQSRRRRSPRRRSTNRPPRDMADASPSSENAVDATQPTNEPRPARTNAQRSRRASNTSAGAELRAPASGFADNIPAFLRRPVPRPARRTAKTGAEEQSAAPQSESDA
ncbi:MAG: DEAD/DEAH box helicase [Pseudomonadota bacterium]